MDDDDDDIAGATSTLSPRMEELANARSRLEMMFLDQERTSSEYSTLLKSIGQSLQSASMQGDLVSESEDVSDLLGTPVCCIHISSARLVFDLFQDVHVWNDANTLYSSVMCDQ